MINRVKLFVFLLSLVSSFSALAVSLHYHSYYYPSPTDVLSIQSRSNTTSLQVCCYYPTEGDIENLSRTHVSHLSIVAGHFPSKRQVELIERLKIPYTITLSEVFPSPLEIETLNNSKIERLIVTSRDFPTYGEVKAFNGFEIPFTFEILKKEYPLPEHMIIIKMFKEDFTVAFHNKAVPGPGYANFFNDLKTHKMFIAEEMPYGDDPIGANALTKSTFVVRSDWRPMPQDLPVINAFEKSPTMLLTSPWPYNQDLFDTVGQFKAKKIVIEDDSYGILLRPDVQIWANQAQSEIVFSFNRFH